MDNLNNNLDLTDNLFPNNDNEVSNLKNDNRYFFIEQGYKTYGSWYFNQSLKKIQKLSLVKALLVSGLSFIFVSCLSYFFQYLLITSKYNNSIVSVVIVILSVLVSFILWILLIANVFEKKYLWSFIVGILYCLSSGSAFSFLFYELNFIEGSIVFSIIGFIYSLTSLLILAINRNAIKLKFVVLYAFIGLIFINLFFLILGFTSDVAFNYFGIETKLLNYCLLIFFGSLFALVYLIYQLWLINRMKEFKNEELNNQYSIFLGIKILLSIYFIVFELLIYMHVANYSNV
ncbi:hypothetical protein D8X55_04215 [Malacoplasma penetrans]|uniref:Transmembrane protein n=1 Tax=Malacoplasma penetrans (strain HF-2) TaxID=272633 RepID=Q8EWI9_MALP2|nr:hypothetical protein [Malacoplasma penetrans]RXY96295.1 hypothetical protein D8X55_04215 [Malacoplasma penetrans]BAC44005.1 hypothetical protein [Malacoplasma penetrans HF-2]